MSIERCGCKQKSRFTHIHFLHQTHHKSKMHPDEASDALHRRFGTQAGGAYCVDTKVFSCPRTSVHILRPAAAKTSFCLSSFFVCCRARVSAKPQTTEKKVSLIKHTTVLLLCLKKHAHFIANHWRTETHRWATREHSFHLRSIYPEDPGICKVKPLREETTY